jgi:hypothetical protein
MASDLNHRAADALRALYEQGHIDRPAAHPPWLPGMSVRFGGPRSNWARTYEHGRYAYSWSKGTKVPTARQRRDWSCDTTDPATIGCLMALLREALGDPAACTETIRASEDDPAPMWSVWSERLDRHVAGSHLGSEAEAIVSALEAAGLLGAR